MTLTSLIPDLYEGLAVVSRELVGMIPAVNMSSLAERAAINQTIRVPQTQAQTSETITPAATVPATGAQTVDNTTLTISNQKAVPILWTGEEQKGFQQTGQYSNVRAQMFAQAFRTLTNEIEATLTGLYVGASRAYGTAATTPFATKLDEMAQLKKILDDNGAPIGDRTLVINTLAGVNLRSLANISASYAAGTDQTLRQGTLLPLFGFDVKESAQVKAHTKGAGTGYTINKVAGYATGNTTITFDGVTVNVTGIKAGDLITNGTQSDTNKYVIKTGSTATSGDIVIANPGNRKAWVNDDSLTIGGDYTANLGFSRGAIALATRLPAAPVEGDLASDATVIQDPYSGLAFEVRVYPIYHAVRIEISIAWGAAVVNPEHLAILIG
jgi:uncharacterized protein YukE